MTMNKDNHIYRSKIKTPAGQNYFSKVTEVDEMTGKYQGGLILDPKNKEHKEFIALLTEIENSCRDEAGHEEVEETTAIKTGTNKQGKKFQYIKAGSGYQPPTKCNVNGWTPLKYDPWSDDIIQMAVQPVYNMGKKNTRHQGLKLYLAGLVITEEGASKQEKYGGAGKKDSTSGADLLGIELPTEIEATPDSGEEIEDFVL